MRRDARALWQSGWRHGSDHNGTAASRRSRGFRVCRVVANHEARREIGAEALARGEKHPGRRFPTVAAGVWEMRAKEVARDTHTLTGEIRLEMRLESRKVDLAVIATGDTALVRNDCNLESGVSEAVQASCDAREQRIIRDAVHITRVAHERSVAVHEYERTQDASAHLGALTRPAAVARGRAIGKTRSAHTATSAR